MHISFEEWVELNETPNGHIGEWEAPDMGYVGKILSSETLDKRYELLSSDSGYSYYLKKDQQMAIGVDEGTNEIVIQLKVSSFNLFDSSTAKQTNKVKVADKYLNNGHAKKLYSLLLENGFVLVSDYDQYDGARALWKSLGRGNKYHSYIFNEVNETLFEYKDFDYKDASIWDFNNTSKEYVLLVLSKNPLKIQ